MFLGVCPGGQTTLALRCPELMSFHLDLGWLLCFLSCFSIHVHIARALRASLRPLLGYLLSYFLNCSWDVPRPSESLEEV